MPLNKEFQSAVRGFHYYKRYWSPRLEEELFCSHERDNAFDVFAIKITDQCGNIRGHLPQERENNQVSVGQRSETNTDSDF